MQGSSDLPIEKEKGAAVRVLDLFGVLVACWSGADSGRVLRLQGKRLAVVKRAMTGPITD